MDIVTLILMAVSFAWGYRTEERSEPGCRGETEPRLKRRMGDVAAERRLICLFDDDRSHHLGMDRTQKVVGAECVEVGPEKCRFDRRGAKESLIAHDGPWLLRHLERRIDRS